MKEYIRNRQVTTASTENQINLM